MQKIILLLLLTAFYRVVAPEKSTMPLTTVVGPKAEEKDSRIGSIYLGKDAGGNYYYFRVSMTMMAKKSYFIDKLDKNLNVVQSKPVVYDQHSTNKLSVFFNAFRDITTDKTYFMGVNEGAGAKAVVSALEIKKSNQSLASSGKVIDNTEKTGGQHWITHDLLASYDSTVLAYLTRTSADAYDGRQGAGGKYRAAVFSSNQNVQWAGDIEFPWAKGEGTVKSIYLSNDGYVNFLVILNPGKKIPNVSSIVTDYSVLKWKIFRFKGADVKTVDLTLNDRDISYADIAEGKNGVTVTGVYSKGKGTNALGVFSINIDKNNSTKSTVSAFPTGFFTAVLKHKISNESSWDWNMSRIFSLHDGGLMWSIEQDFSNSGTSENAQSYNHDLDALIVHVNADNSIAPLSVFHKQQSYNSSFVSTPTAPFVYNDQLYILYLDNPANTGITGNNEVATWEEKHEEPSIMLARLNSDGSFTKETVLAPDRDNKWFSPLTVISAGDGEFIGWWKSSSLHKWSKPLKFSFDPNK